MAFQISQFFFLPLPVCQQIKFSGKMGEEREQVLLRKVNRVPTEAVSG